LRRQTVAGFWRHADASSAIVASLGGSSCPAPQLILPEAILLDRSLLSTVWQQRLSAFWETIMRKSITAAAISAALCFPSIGLAQTSGSFQQQTFTSEEDCEEARAEERRRQNTFEGRERGQFNKRFNAMFQCEQTAGVSTTTESDDRFMIRRQS
jgi:hypothetical protein